MPPGPIPFGAYPLRLLRKIYAQKSTLARKKKGFQSGTAPAAASRVTPAPECCPRPPRSRACVLSGGEAAYAVRSSWRPLRLPRLPEPSLRWISRNFWARLLHLSHERPPERKSNSPSVSIALSPVRRGSVRARPCRGGDDGPILEESSPGSIRRRGTKPMPGPSPAERGERGRQS